MRFGSLFAGIGGFDLGLERAGWECVWQVEIDDYCNRILERHWPHVERCRDIREFGYEARRAVDAVCGGFPCQDISIAGRGRGLHGGKSGLWWEMYRVVQEYRPRWVIIENTPPLASRGLEKVLYCLAEAGYDAEWEVISAQQFGKMHRRERLFIVAYTDGIGCNLRRGCNSSGEVDCGPPRSTPKVKCDTRRDLVAYLREFYDDYDFPISDPPTKRIIDGIPNRLDRVRVCGNAVVVDIAEWIGGRINRIDTPTADG